MSDLDRYRDCRLLPPREAAAALGISERALRFRFAAGTIERHREGATVLYVVPTATTARLPRRSPAVDTGIPDTAATATVALAPLVEALVAAERRAVAAEIEAAQLRVEIERVRVEAERLAAAHVKRGALLREIAADLQAARDGLALRVV